MKKHLLLFLAAVALGFTTAARAEVLIYKGNGKVISTPGMSLPKTFELFIVLDIAGNEFGFVVFFEDNGTKTQIGGVPADYHFTTSPLPGGGTARLFSSSFVSEALPDFIDSLIYFRGTQKTLRVATGAFDTTRNEPRTIKGTQLQAREEGGMGAFQEARYFLTYQETRTVEANNGTQTIQQALDAIVAGLTEKGFNPP